MSNTTNNTEGTETEDALPPLPVAALDPIQMLKLGIDDVRAKVVGCSTCPVFMLCESSTGGSGYTCKTCKATGVFLDEDKEDEVLVLDCFKHKFGTKTGGELEKCPLCSGTMMKFEYREMPPKSWIIFTEHAVVPLETRIKTLNESLDHWKTHYAEEAEKEAQEKEKVEKSAKKSK